MKITHSATVLDSKGHWRNLCALVFLALLLVSHNPACHMFLITTLAQQGDLNNQIRMEETERLRRGQTSPLQFTLDLTA